jgi:hypothetical protein
MKINSNGPDGVEITLSEAETAEALKTYVNKKMETPGEGDFLDSERLESVTTLGCGCRVISFKHVKK